MPGVDDLPALFQLIDDLRSQGLDGAAIAAYLKHLDREAFDAANEEARAEGATDEELAAFWQEVARFGDTEPEDMVDCDDPLYGTPAVR